MYHSKEHFEESKKDKLISGILIIIVGVIVVAGVVWSIVNFNIRTTKTEYVVTGLFAVVAIAAIIVGSVLLARKR